MQLKPENFECFDKGRVLWRETKLLKTQVREQRHERRVAEARKKYGALIKKDAEARLDGRIDFTIEELFEMLYCSYVDARKNKRNTYDVQRLEVHLFDVLYQLAQDIYDRCYCPSRSEAFIIFDPVVREVFAAAFRDRIVHHLLINICMSWWNRRFVRDSYSCRVGKGTDYGVRRAAFHIAKQSQGYTRPAYFVKMDIKGFFMSMDRERLRGLAVRGAHQQFHDFGPLGRLTAYLWTQILLDNPLESVRIRGKFQDWEQLPMDKSLFFQAEGRGIVIGNLTSQLISNIFLNQLDQFIIYQLGYPHYGRYVDDFYVVITEEQLPQMRKDLERIRLYLASMGLTLHPHKTKWLLVEKGVPYLGHIIRNGHIEKDYRYQANYLKALREVVQGAKNLETVTSYMGGCVNYGCRKMQQKLWEISGQEFMM